MHDTFKSLDLFYRHAYKVGGLVFTLDEMEHGVLRCNRGHPSNPGIPTFQDENDPRRDLALKHFDPRIHFALNCGGKHRKLARQLQVNKHKIISLKG